MPIPLTRTRWLICHRLSQLKFYISKILATPSTLSWGHNFHQPIRLRDILPSFLNSLNTIIWPFFRLYSSKRNFLRVLCSEGPKLVFSKRAASKIWGGSAHEDQNEKKNLNSAIQFPTKIDFPGYGLHRDHSRAKDLTSTNYADSGFYFLDIPRIFPRDLSSRKGPVNHTGCDTLQIYYL